MAALLTAFVNQLHIVGGYHYSGIAAYMVGNPFILHPVGDYLFFALLPLAANGLGSPVPVKGALYPEAIKPFLDAVLLVSAEIALGITEVINGVQQVGLAAAIWPCNTGYIGLEIKLSK